VVCNSVGRQEASVSEFGAGGKLLCLRDFCRSNIGSDYLLRV